MVRSEVTVEDSEGNVNGAGIQEEGRTWCRDVARREGQDSAFESIWLQDMEERERAEGKGMVLKGHVRLWIQEREPMKQACA